MSSTGLDVFDRTIQNTHLLKDIMEDLGPDRQVAYRVLGAVLHALRDRLTVDEAAHLGAQLPLLVRGIYFDQWHPAGKPNKIRDRDECLQRIREELRDTRPIDPEDAVRSVFKSINRHVSAGEVEDVYSSLPQDLRRLWPQGGTTAQTG